MATKERPVLVAIISTMGIIIAALITSGYLKQNSAAKKEDAQEARIQSLENELKQKDDTISDLKKNLAAAASQVDAKKVIVPTPQPVVPTPAVNLEELAAKLAEEKKTQVLGLEGSVKGAIAKDAVKEYVFIGHANTPVLFTLQQPSRHFWASVEVYDSQGLKVLEGQDFIRSKDEISFTPPRDDAYILHLSGDRNFGDFLIVMSLLGGSSR